MFWRTSPKRDGRGKKNDSSPSSPTPHRFHVNPSKPWSYYNNASQAELYDLVKVRKADTATTSESSTWSYTLEKLMKEQSDEAMCVDEDEDEGSGFFFTPEGITRVPFTSWEYDLMGAARLASYYQSDAYQHSAKDGRCKARAMTSFQQAAHCASTPHNSPRPHL